MRVDRNILFFVLILFAAKSWGQEVGFFSEGTGATYYDQGVVDKSALGQSSFEYTYPPNYPQYNDKVPCSNKAFKGSTSLKFNYRSSDQGAWKVTIYRSSWASADLSALDSIAFYMYSDVEFPNTALPLIGLRATKKSGSGETNSKMYKLVDYNTTVPTAKWVKIKFPLSVIVSDSGNSELNMSSVKGIILGQSESNNSSRLIYIDELTAFKSISEVPSVSGLTADGYDSHVELNWTSTLSGAAFRVYASFDQGQNFQLRAETAENYYLDFVPSSAKNTTITYRVVTVAQNKESAAVEKSATVRDYSDDELMDLVQRYSFRYFWEGAHQASGMALERSNSGATTAASGATGMGLMAMIVAHERQYKPREEVKDRILKILNFLETCDRHHGAWSHWYDASTGRTKPFSQNDDGGDLVETSFVAQALIALKNYFSATDAKSTQIRETSERLWRGVEWDWYRKDGQNALYWHWSPNNGFQMNMKVTGWNEALVTYVMAAASPTHSIPKEVYEQGWTRNGGIVNARTFYDLPVKLSPDYGGPLFWLHYSHLGINPHGLKDQSVDYWQEHVNTAKIHYQYAIKNPFNYKNYSDKCWGLTASDDPQGYSAHQPMSNDNGTISPTAALASMPYTPTESLKALKYFYRERGAELFGKYGPFDAFNDQQNWVKKAWLGIDQGPIVVMIENHRTGLLWNQVMKDPQLRAGLDKLGFQYEITSVSSEYEIGTLDIFPNPVKNMVMVKLPAPENRAEGMWKIIGMNGHLMKTGTIDGTENHIRIDCSGMSNGIYLFRLDGQRKSYQSKIIIQK